jgi:hypothetical protein
MEPKIVDTNNTKWINRHLTFEVPIDKLYDVWNSDNGDILHSYCQMSKLIQTEMKACMIAGTPMRFLGGGWTWSKIATAPNGRMYNTKGLNHRFTLAPSLIDESYTGHQDDLLFVQCGVSVHELNSYLKRKRRSIKTSGASNGQTIVGAMSTGTHGSAFDFGAIQDFVVGLHLITGPDPDEPTHNVYLERNTYPVTRPDFAERIGAMLIRDDELFNAALVSFGSFGFIHGVMIETEPIYLLECYRQRVNDPGFDSLISTLDFDLISCLPKGHERPHHFQITYNPHDMQEGPYVSTMYKIPYAEEYEPPKRDQGIGPGDDAPAFIGLVGDFLPGSIPKVVNRVVAGSYKTYGKTIGTRGEIFGDTELRGKLISAAVGFPIAEASRVIKMMVELNADKRFGPFAGVYALRFVKATQATLGFTCFNPCTCVLELDCVWSKRMLTKFIPEAWRRLEQEGIPFNFHWGKQSEITRERLLKGYGQQRLDSWNDARRRLLAPEVLTLFNNEQLKEWGLDTQPLV